MPALDTTRDGGIWFFAGIATSRRAHVSAGFFFGLGALVLLLFAAGLIAIGRPAGVAALSSDSGPGLKNARQPGGELGLVADHAGGDAIDVRNLWTTQAERVAAAGLLLFGRIGRRRCGPERKREYRCQHQTELDILRPANRHEIPRGADLREVWVNGGDSQARVAR